MMKKVVGTALLMQYAMGALVTPIVSVCNSVF